MKSTFAYRPFWTDTKGFRTIKWPSTLACHLFWLLKERKVGPLSTAVIKVSNGIVRRQAIRSADPVHPVSATTWSNKGCWVVMSGRDMGEPDSFKKKRKGIYFLVLSAEICRHTMNAPWKSPFASPSSMRRCKPTETAPALSPQLEWKEESSKLDCRLGRGRIHCNSVGVTTEGTNVFLDPFQCETLCIRLNIWNHMTFKRYLRSPIPKFPIFAACASFPPRNPRAR